MRVHRSLKSLLSLLALTAILLPHSQLAGAELPGSTPIGKTHDRSLEKSNPNIPAGLKPGKTRITDVALDRQGFLRGSLVDQLGLPLPGKMVVARQGKSKVRTTRTDGRGAFALAGLKGGVWHVTLDTQTVAYRVWPADIAPPIAESQALVVKKSTIIRGQSEETSMLAAFDAGTLFSVGAGVAGITLGTIGISEAAEANDEADALRRELNTLSATVDAIAATLN